VAKLNPLDADLITVALGLTFLHFSVPLLYYQYAKTRWFPIPWNTLTSTANRPQISVVIPAYSEEAFIERKLENLLAEDYPRDLLEILVMNPASTDRTAELVSNWTRNHIELSVKLVTEPQNDGKLKTMLRAFECVSRLSQLVIFTDADVQWDNAILQKAARYFDDPNVGAMTATIDYSTEVPIESHYRKFYNVLRIAESKKHSTPIHEGGFQALSLKILREIGVPVFAGSNDSAFGSYFALAGFRSIQADDIVVRETMRGSQVLAKVRRAQHLTLNFLSTKRYAKRKGVYRKTEFEKIWKMEFWLIVVNPWMLLASIVLLIVSLIHRLTPLPLLPLLLGSILFSIKAYRVWMSQQAYLLAGSVRSLITRSEMWRAGRPRIP
jgi:glycosyltransferase involved in cell wall biosynthesis